MKLSRKQHLTPKHLSPELQAVSSGLTPLGLLQTLRPPDRWIDVVPLFNVLLLGFLFFVLGSRFVFAPGISIELPQSEAKWLPGALTVDVLTVKNAHFIIFQGTKYNLSGLAKRLASDSWVPPFLGATVLLKADQSVNLQTFVSISQMMKAAGYATVQLAVSMPSREESSPMASDDLAAPFFR